MPEATGIWMTNVGVKVIAWNGLSHRRWTRRKTWNSAPKLPTPPMTLLCQAEAVESARSARMSGYNSRTI